MDEAKIREWLGKNEKKHAWLRRYLEKKGVNLAAEEELISAASWWLNQSNSDRAELRGIHLKAAWSTYKSRSNNPKGTLLSTKATLSRLRNLAKEWNLNTSDALDEIVNTYWSENFRQKESAKIEDKIRKSASRLRSHKRKAILKDVEDKWTKNQFEKMEEKYETLAFEYCCAKILLDDNKISTDQLRDDQLDRAKDLFEKRELDRLFEPNKDTNSKK